MKSAESLALKHTFAHVYFPVVLLNVTANLNLGAVSVSMPFLAQATGAGPQLALGLPAGYLCGLVCSTAASSFLARRFGSRSVLTAALSILIAANIATVVIGNNFGLLAFLIFVQGACAGPIPPMMQKLIADSFPPERRGSGMAIWQGSLTIGAMLGALFGGYLISRFGVLWVFSMAPVLALPALLVTFARATSSKNAGVQFDVAGLIFLIATVLSLTLFLSMGGHFGWFSSPYVVALALSIVVFGILLYWALNREVDRVIDLSVLQNRDLAIGIALVLVFFGITSGHTQNQMLVVVFGFGSDLIAERVGYGGPVRLAGVVICGILSVKFSVNRLALFAIILVLIGKFGYVLWQPGMSGFDAIMPFMVESFGQGMFMVCLAALAYQTLGSHQTAAAAVLYALAQRLGGSVGLGFLDAAQSVQETSLNAAGLSLQEAKGAAFLGVAWIELMVCINILLGLYLFGRVRAKAEAPKD